MDAEHKQVLTGAFADGDARSTLLRLFVAQRTLEAKRPAGTPANILEASIPIFAVRGYAGTSMRDIASAVGIKAASIYEHYKGKDALLLAALTHVLSQFYDFVLETVDPDDSARDQLRAVLQRHLLWQSRSTPIATAWDALFDVQSISEAVADPATVELDNYRTLYHEFVATLVADERPADDRPEATAEAMLSVCNSVARWAPAGIDDEGLLELGWGFAVALLDAN